MILVFSYDIAMQDPVSLILSKDDLFYINNLQQKFLHCCISNPIYNHFDIRIMNAYTYLYTNNYRVFILYINLHM